MAKTLIPAEVTECSLCVKSDVCLTDEILNVVKETTKSASVEEAKKAVGCESQKCLVGKLKGEIDGKLGQGTADRALRERFKLSGPTDSALLSNVNIDNTLRQWAMHFKDFYPYNFNMSDYEKHSYAGGRVLDRPDSLAVIRFADLVSGKVNGDKYKTAACVINTDVYSGPGKHWMALFADVRSVPATVEFFNSSGRGPTTEWLQWLYSTRDELEAAGYTVRVIKGYGVRHQQSKSECGVYSLYYIWCRLNGVPCDRFTKIIPDKYMFEFRQHLFNGPIAVKDGVFNYDEFRKNVKIKWED